MDCIKYVLTLFWRVVFAFIPPPGRPIKCSGLNLLNKNVLWFSELLGGFATFVICVFFIALNAALLGDLAYALGCTVGLKLRVTSLILVSIGTSVPGKIYDLFIHRLQSILYTVYASTDMFASKVFAKRSPTADACITNVFGSNIIQIYLGLGITWTMGSVHHYLEGKIFDVLPSS